jgi:hypothetical protein
MIKFSHLIAVLGLLLAPPASATTLLSLPITSAIGTTTTPLQFKEFGSPQSLAIQCNFTYG